MAFVRALDQILDAGVGITALSLWLYALTFNLRNRVTFAYTMVLFSLALTFGGKSLGSASAAPALAAMWFRLRWVGGILLPAAYLHFSDALLATTGRPSRGRRRAAVRLAYGLSAVLIVLLFRGGLLGAFVEGPGLPRYLPGRWTWAFVAFYAVGMIWAWVNFVRAFRRTVVRTSRRRMAYLLLGALAPTLGAFPYATFLGAWPASTPLLLGSLAALSSALTTVLLLLMAYAVAFFGAAWPDRVVRVRLFRWILRGPVAVSSVLALTTAVRRLGERYFGQPYTVLVPLVMVLGFLLVEHLIGATAPLWEPLVSGSQRDALLARLRHWEERLFTAQDLTQFLEAVLASLCDHLRVPHAFIAAIEEQSLSLLVSIGETPPLPSGSAHVLFTQPAPTGLLQWDDCLLLPLRHPEEGALLGVMGFPAEVTLTPDARATLHRLAERAALALAYYRQGMAAAKALRDFGRTDDFIPRLRAIARYNQAGILTPRDELPPSAEIVQWVKDALSHYWGGPKLSRSPLTRLQVTQQAMAESEDASQAVRSVLREAVERLRPEGERRFTTEWLLYNILEMKFLQGRKVREVAARLALSEANFYRKQRVALEEVVRVLLEMEAEARAADAPSPAGKKMP